MKINNGSSLKEYIEAASVDRVDTAELHWITDLQDLLGSESIITDEDVITRHSNDVWPVTAKWRSQGKRPFAPNVVIEALSIEQASKILQWANENNIPVTPWGGDFTSSQRRFSPLALCSGGAR